MIKYYQSLDPKVQGAIIGGFFSLVIFFLGWVFKIVYDRYSLSFKLKREFQFEQKKSIKQEIAKTKTPLLNVSEELNYRLWNFIPNIDENWHSEMVLKYRTGNFCNFQSNETRNEYEEEVQKV
jgi:hypothetical protein